MPRGHRVTDDDGAYCPIDAYQRSLRPRTAAKYRMEEGDLQRRCTRCRDFYPCDTEFFYGHSTEGLHCYCKACYHERVLTLKDARAA